MTAERPKGPQFGASAEHVAQFIIGTFAFVTLVPYQMDIGVDFQCVFPRKASVRDAVDIKALARSP